MGELRQLTGDVRRNVARMVSDWEASQQSQTGVAPSTEATAVWGEQAIIEAVEAANRSRIANGQAPISDNDGDEVIRSVRSSIFGNGRLDALLADPEVENIVANGHDNVTLTKVGGYRVEGPPLADSEEEFEDLIRRLAATAGKTERRFDDGQPYLDLRLPDGSRLHAIKTVTSKLCASIRKHRHMTITLDELVGLGTIEPGLAHFLEHAVRPPSPCSILVAGGTDTGKTTFLRGLISQIPQDERLVVIEDNAELGLEMDPRRARYVVEMEVRQPNIEGKGGIGMDVLGKQALRMRPDRVIVGESRSGHEVRTMLEAMNSGHEGSLTTIHSDSALSALTKMQTYALTGDDALSMEASAHLISLVLHLVVHLTKLPDGTRAVTSVRDVFGAPTGDSVGQIASNEIFAAGPDGVARRTQTGLSERLRSRLEASGYDDGYSMGAVA